MEKLKVYKIIKTCIFVIAAILLFVFAEKIMENNGALINGVVGTVIAYYGVEGIIVPLITRKDDQIPRIHSGLINLLIAVIMILLLENNISEIRVVCSLWGLWSIIREGDEIFEESVPKFKKAPVTAILDILESIIVIYFSIALVCAKDLESLLHHAHVHIILLGIELLLEITWDHIYHFEEFLRKRLKK